MRRLVLATLLGLAGSVITTSAARPSGWETRPTDDPGSTTESTTGKKESTENAIRGLPTTGKESSVDRVIDRWMQHVRKNERDDQAWAELGDALMQKVRETADCGYYAHAERSYRQALTLDPKNVSATVGMAWVHGCRHEFEQSIEWANKALKLDPRNSSAFGLLGDAAVEMGNYDTAYEHVQQMLDIRPDMSSYSRGAHLLFMTGNVRKALWLMDKAVDAAAPYAENSAWCRAELAKMHVNVGNLSAAEQVLKEGLARTPNNYHLLTVMGKVKVAQNDNAGAIECYQKVADMAPQHEVLVALGDLYRLAGDKEAAEKQYATVEAIHRLNKENGIRGDTQMALFYADHDGNLAEAVKLAEEEYRTRKNVQVADALAWCYYKNGQYEQAKRAIQKALSKKTPDARIRFHAGMIFDKLGDKRAAQIYLYQALSMNPGFSPVYAPAAAEKLKELGGKPASDAAAEEAP